MKKKLSDKHKRKISASLMGNQHAKGYKWTKEQRKRASEAHIGVFANEKHPFWKGNEVSYRGLHKWVERKLGFPNKCESCGEIENNRRKIHWANKSGKYKRDLKDWIRLCAKCHYKKDDIYKNQKRDSLTGKFVSHG